MSIRARFRKVHLFFFIDHLWDISNSIWEGDLSEIQQEIESWGQKASSGFTDYGVVFRELAEDKLAEVSSRATLLIFGDGKNNYRPAQVEYLAQIAEKVRHIFWLNPLIIKDWYEPDNLMKTYQDHCSKVYRCRTAEDLQRIVEDVI